jgi:hypothetical protein
MGLHERQFQFFPSYVPGGEFVKRNFGGKEVKLPL